MNEAGLTNLRSRFKDSPTYFAACRYMADHGRLFVLSDNEKEEQTNQFCSSNIISAAQ